MDTKATGQLIAARRKERGLSQLELAKRLHVTDKAVSRWETGRGMPALETLEPLGEVLGLTVSELLAGRELTEAELPETAGKQILEGLRKARKQLWCGAAVGEVLGLTVSELLAGRELTEAELPETAGKQILEGLRKARKQLWCGAAVMLAAMGLAAGLFLGWHYVTSVEVTDVAAADRTALTRQAERYLSQLNRESRGAGGTLSMVDLEQRGNYLAALCVEEDEGWDLCIYEERYLSQLNRESRGAGGTLSMVDLEQRGNYLAALCVEEDEGWDLCIYDRDSVFKNRWKATGGAFGMECGTVNSWNFGSAQGETVIAFGGWGLPQDIKAYSFEHDGITCIAPVGDGGRLLDLFVVPDSRTIAPANLTLLDESGRMLPYPNPWKPERNS